MWQVPSTPTASVAQCIRQSAIISSKNQVWILIQIFSLFHFFKFIETYYTCLFKNTLKLKSSFLKKNIFSAQLSGTQLLQMIKYNFLNTFYGLFFNTFYGLKGISIFENLTLNWTEINLWSLFHNKYNLFLWDFVKELLSSFFNKKDCEFIILSIKYHYYSTVNKEMVIIWSIYYKTFNIFFSESCSDCSTLYIFTEWGSDGSSCYDLNDSTCGLWVFFLWDLQILE